MTFPQGGKAEAHRSVTYNSLKTIQLPWSTLYRISFFYATLWLDYDDDDDKDNPLPETHLRLLWRFRKRLRYNNDYFIMC